jgi:hypothetical protein
MLDDDDLRSQTENEILKPFRLKVSLDEIGCTMHLFEAFAGKVASINSLNFACNLFNFDLSPSLLDFFDFLLMMLPCQEPSRKLLDDYGFLVLQFPLLLGFNFSCFS